MVGKGWNGLVWVNIWVNIGWYGPVWVIMGWYGLETSTFECLNSWYSFRKVKDIQMPKD